MKTMLLKISVWTLCCWMLWGCDDIVLPERLDLDPNQTRISSTDSEKIIDEPVSTDTTTECVADYCNGHGTCSIVDGVAICTCDENWDVDVNCRNCIAGFSEESNCKGCAWGHEFVDGDCLSVCDSLDCNGHGKCKITTEEKAECVCDEGYEVASHCADCADGYGKDVTSQECVACECSTDDTCCDGCQPTMASICDDGINWTENDACNTQGECAGTDWVGWVNITGGGFDMGYGVYDPTHRVTVPSFAIMQTEVTVGQYRRCADEGTCTKPGEAVYGKGTWSDSAGSMEDHPVNYVNWDQAKAYCEWVGGRLPSESEWEYAAKDGGKNYKFPWGNTPDTATCTEAVMSGCAGDTQPACSKSTSGDTPTFGLCDMAGNVWEWTADWYQSDLTKVPTNGSPYMVSSTYRVKRGGSFYATSYYLRAANRSYDDPSFQHYSIGFRCARATVP